MHKDAVHPHPEISDHLNRIYRLHRTDIDFRLGRSPYEDLLIDLGSPHLKLPPVIHTAGTNGKGSTQAFMQAILQEAGYKVHAYTSPHLLVFNERITLANTRISDEELLDALRRVEVVNGTRPITFFEFTTALALMLFAEQEADFCLLETGMGGRLDCTNIVPDPLCTVITKIGMDHMQYLGDTVAKIAGEKAGIMKKDVPCVLSLQEFEQDVYKVVEEKAKELNCPLHKIKEPLAKDTSLSLKGMHQYENAANAVEVVKILQNKGYEITEGHIRAGLSNTKWDGRLQSFHGHPDLPKEWELWFDGGHNISAAKALQSQFEEWHKEGVPLIVIHGMQADKDAASFLEPLKACINHLYCIDVDGMRPQTGTALKAKIEHMITVDGTVEEKTALKDIAAHHRSFEKARVLILGSLYLYNVTNISDPLEIAATA